MVQINGVPIAQPYSLQVTLTDIEGDGARDSTGRMYRDRIAVKRTLSCEWGVLTGAEMGRIMREINGVYCRITYPDPLTGVEESRVFYAGDRSSPVCTLHGGHAEWQGLTIEFNEK